MLRRRSTAVLATPSPPAACDVRAYSNSGWLWSCFRYAVHIGASFGGFIQLRNKPGILIFPSPRRRLSGEAFEPDYREGPTARFPGHAERLACTPSAHSRCTYRILWCCIYAWCMGVQEVGRVYTREGRRMSPPGRARILIARPKSVEKERTRRTTTLAHRSSPSLRTPQMSSFVQAFIFIFCQVHTSRTQL